MGAGVLFCAVIWIFVALTTGPRPFTLARSDASRLAMLLIVVGLLTGHVLVTSLQVGATDFGRFFSSCGSLLMLCIAAHFAATAVTRLSAKQLDRATGVAWLLLTLIGFAAAAGVPPIGPQTSVKPVVIFSEPSHFALAYLPMLLCRVAVARRFSQVLLMGTALMLAALLQSLTLVAGIVVLSVLLFRGVWLAGLIIAVAGAAATLDLTYYSSRLTFESDTINVSTLVFLQGWENAVLDFLQTDGLGVGFQQFGIAGSLGELTYRIAAILGGSYINLLDGGSTAPKVIGEFGVAGILMLVAYIRQAARGCSFIRQAQSLPPTRRDQKMIFYHSLIITYSFELFVRGYGYFSPGGLLALTALLCLYRSSQPEELSAVTGATPTTAILR
jgi:hypothetical protein